MKLLIVTLAVLSALTLSSTVRADDTFDGYWYCPTAIYPRIDGEPAPEVGCTATEPVFISDDGVTATGVTTGVYRGLPPTGAGSGLLVVAALLVVAGGGACRLSRASESRGAGPSRVQSVAASYPKSKMRSSPEASDAVKSRRPSRFSDTAELTRNENVVVVSRNTAPTIFTEAESSWNSNPPTTTLAAAAVAGRPPTVTSVEIVPAPPHSIRAVPCTHRPIR